MKALLCILVFISSAFAQNPDAYLKSFDSKIYSIRTKGVQDLVVDIESTKLTKQLNDQQVFGKVKEVTFRTYWTANPERLAIEVMGLPEGFKEVKEELKASIMGLMESLIPLTIAQKFIGHKITATTKPKEFFAKEISGLAPITGYILKFDQQDKLVEIEAQKPIGSLVLKPVYEKRNFSDGKWVLTSQTSTAIENGQMLTVTKELDYEASQGMTVLSEIETITEQKSLNPSAKSTSTSETVTFKNYKINAGEAMKYFLSEPSTPAPKASP